MAAKTPLPFRTAPQAAERVVGDARSGELVFPVMGDLSVREQLYISQALAQRSSFVEIAKVSNKIARAEKIAPLAAHRFLSNVIAQALGLGEDLEDVNENRRIKYAKEIEDLSAMLLEQQWRRQVAYAAAVIRYRIKGQQHFDLSDAEALGKGLVGAIYQFALEEEVASLPAGPTPAEADAMTEEGLGK
jgi:hypothetical protein